MIIHKQQRVARNLNLLKRLHPAEVEQGVDTLSSLTSHTINKCLFMVYLVLPTVFAFWCFFVNDIVPPNGSQT